MAGLRITKRTHEDIMNNGYNLFNKQIDKAKETLADDFWQRAVEAYVLTECIPYMRDMPEAWIVTCNAFDIRIKPITTTKNICWESGNLIKPVRVPNLQDLLVRYGSTRQIKITGGQSHEGWEAPMELRNEITKHQLYVERAMTQRTEFQTNLAGYLDKCNTLKQFLNAWPQGEELIPSHVLELHRTPAIKKPVIPRPAMEFDSTTLNAGLLRQKIMQNT